MSLEKFSLGQSDMSKWIVAMLGNGSSCLQYLRDLLLAMKSFFHPSNNGPFKYTLSDFLIYLTNDFVDRVHLERKSHPVWFSTPPQSHRLTEQDITDFVCCVREYVFISIFNKSLVDIAGRACQKLAILRPELIVPSLIERHFSSLDSINEPHRFTSILLCLTYVARQIVHATPSYPEGQSFVLPLLISVLPGIDLNDSDKTEVTLQFLRVMLSLIVCVDCSSAVNTRDDLTETEKEVCLSTARFEEFIVLFLDRIFHIIHILSTSTSHDDDDDCSATIVASLSLIIFDLAQQCSQKFFQSIRNRIGHLIDTTCLSSKVRQIISSIVWGLIMGKPVETLKQFLPKICQSIERILDNLESDDLLADDEEDIQLNFYLNIFMKLISSRTDALIIYRKMIMSVLHRCVKITNKTSYQILGSAIEIVLRTLTEVYPTDYRITVENLEQPFRHFLPIRAWGQCVRFDDLQLQFHLPNADEIDYACELVQTFLYPQLTLLNEKGLQMSNSERLKALTLIQSIVTGCFRLVKRIESTEVKDLIPSGVPYDSNHRIDFPIYSKEPNLQENLRTRLLNDLDHFLDLLARNQSDDVVSITKALKLYSFISMYYGISINEIDDERIFLSLQAKFFKNKLHDQGQGIRYLMIHRIVLQMKELQRSQPRILTQIDKQIILKLFDFSIHRYSAIRREAQNELFQFVQHYRYSFEVIVDRLVELLTQSSSNELNDDQIKGCLYILLGNDSSFFPTYYSWTMKRKLWPVIACLTHTKKKSVQQIIENIITKIDKNFVTENIVQSVNQISRDAAITLWRPIQSSETYGTRDVDNRNDVQSYTDLMETLSSLMEKKTLTWGQQKATITLLSLLLQKHVPIPSSCIRTFADLLVHHDINLQKYATKGLVAFCRIQKSPRIYVQKASEEMFPQTDPSSAPGDRLLLAIADYKPPTTQNEWEETCFLDKLSSGYYSWPTMIKYPVNKRERYTLDNMPAEVAVLYERLAEKNFLHRAIQAMVLDENKGEVRFDPNRFTMFKGLFRNFGLLLLDHFMEELSMLIHETIREKEERSHRVAAEIVAGMIRGSKYWTLEMLEQLWNKLRPFLTEMCSRLTIDTRYHWYQCFKYSMEKTDPRRLTPLIEFLLSLVSDVTFENTLNETSRWYLMDALIAVHWRIPSIWRSINDRVKKLVDHSSKSIRDFISNILAISHSFDVTLFDRRSTCQLSVDSFLEEMYEPLQQAIDIYEKTPLIDISKNVAGLDLEVRRALSLIEAVVRWQTRFFVFCRQPIKSGIVRLLPYFCEMESMTAGNDDVFKSNLIVSRLSVGTSLLTTRYLEALIDQLIKICQSPKWHARRAALEFVQSMIFSNLFNARPYAQQVADLVRQRLFDEQLEVRLVASVTLSGFYQCGYIPVTNDDLKYFEKMGKISYLTIVDGKKVTQTKNLLQRHGGVLGLCAIVLSSPYEISTCLPKALMLLTEHSHDPDLIQKSIKQCLSDFRRTHYDSWHEHREQFTEDQLLALDDAFISHSYYA